MTIISAAVGAGIGVVFSVPLHIVNYFTVIKPLGNIMDNPKELNRDIDALSKKTDRLSKAIMELDAKIESAFGDLIKKIRATRPSQQ